MLKPNELFIGAVLNYDTGEGIEPFAMGAQGLLFMEENPITFNDDHSPIPLTPEILTDWCGWNQDGYKVYKPIHAKGVNKMMIAFYKFQRDVKLMHYGEYITSLPHVKYLHQLQALYQLLTGEVMPIKLPKE